MCINLRNIETANLDKILILKNNLNGNFCSKLKKKNYQGTISISDSKDVFIKDFIFGNNNDSTFDKKFCF